jgi:hypothetical protein
MAFAFVLINTGYYANATGAAQVDAPKYSLLYATADNKIYALRSRSALPRLPRVLGLRGTDRCARRPWACIGGLASRSDTFFAANGLYSLNK